VWFVGPWFSLSAHQYVQMRLCSESSPFSQRLAHRALDNDPHTSASLLLNISISDPKCYARLSDPDTDDGRSSGSAPWQPRPRQAVGQYSYTNHQRPVSPMQLARRVEEESDDEDVPYIPRESPAHVSHQVQCHFPSHQLPCSPHTASEPHGLPRPQRQVNPIPFCFPSPFINVHPACL